VQRLLLEDAQDHHLKRTGKEIAWLGVLHAADG
jgi:hypothetical protein